MLTGKTVLLGVTGGIAAYKSAALASMLVKQHANVNVLMTEHAKNFITPITFETLTGNRCQVDTFDRNFEFHVAHISLAKSADVAIAAPATANAIGKMAHGIADDMLTTTLLACTCSILIAPAMNTRMYENSIVQENLQILKRHGMKIIEPAQGHLACGDTGIGKMPEPEELLQAVLREAACKKDLLGKHILITAGPTQELIDPVRYITNHSTGKMGYAIAQMAMLRGAEVTLVTGPTSIEPPSFVRVIPVTSAKEMFDKVTEHAETAEIIIMSAAVADYTPRDYFAEKVKKSDEELSIPLARTSDILDYLGHNRHPGQFICGFSMETENLLENSKKKLEKKNVDMIVANNLRVEGAGFGTDTNVVSMITKDGVTELPQMSKLAVADALLNHITLH